uniref:Uncharacterized protein n=1 Tax=Polytomella parva TaxID=51329 RepID=A0A7S0VA15_9CHLO|mmetsp:Transcript_33627/g.60717  ORF Transcript_33627/g.60717 Transcript_33627/m.60717 type:complete len:137 (+) Transcript_33627:2-412(+)
MGGGGGGGGGGGLSGFRISTLASNNSINTTNSAISNLIKNVGTNNVAREGPTLHALSGGVLGSGQMIPLQHQGYFVCPLFKFVAEFGAKHNLSDDDDCLLTALLPPGSRSVEYWVTHNVCLIAVADPFPFLDILSQ